MLYILYLTSHNSSDVFIKLDLNPKCSRYIHIYIYIYIFLILFSFCFYFVSKAYI